MKNKEFFIEMDGMIIHSKLEFPKELEDKNESDVKVDVVVLVHGIADDMEYFPVTTAAKGILAGGMACLRVDMFGHGKSAGNFRDHNVMLWVTQLMFIIDYVKRLDFVSGIVLAGHSQGGLASLLAGAFKEKDIKSIVMISPGLAIKKRSIAGVMFGEQLDLNDLPDEVTLWGKYVLSTNYLHVAKCLPVDEAIASFSKPVYIVHGTGDTVTLLSDSIDADERLKQSELVCVEGASHDYDEHLNELQEAVKSCIEKCR